MVTSFLLWRYSKTCNLGAPATLSKIKLGCELEDLSILESYLPHWQGAIDDMPFAHEGIDVKLFSGERFMERIWRMDFDDHWRVWLSDARHVCVGTRTHCSRHTQKADKCTWFLEQCSIYQFPKIQLQAKPIVGEDGSPVPIMFVHITNKYSCQKRKTDLTIY